MRRSLQSEFPRFGRLIIQGGGHLPITLDRTLSQGCGIYTSCCFLPGATQAVTVTSNGEVGAQFTHFRSLFGRAMEWTSVYRPQFFQGCTAATRDWGIEAM